MVARAVLAGAVVLGLGFMPAVAVAQQRVLPQSMNSLVAQGYEPSDNDERGLWDQLERFEENLLASDLIVRDPALGDYVRSVVARVAGGAAGNIRVVVLRSPSFNASMYPNGLMLVHTGLLLRVRNEAELAGVLAHEVGHFARLHSLRAWRDSVRRRGISNFLQVGVAILGGATRTSTYDTINSLQVTTVLGISAYSRRLESEADAMGLRLIAEAGYRPRAMSDMWASVIAEDEASAAAQGRRRRPTGGLLASHPSSDQRMLHLTQSAAEMPEGGGDEGTERYRAAIATHLPVWLREQVMLNDSGASFHILGRLAQGNWTGLLRYWEGEAFRLRDRDGDRARAAEAYAAAVALPDAPPEAWRAHGYALVRAGNRAEGQAALARYLELSPDAADAAMVRQTLAN